MDKKVAVITGGTRGIGFATAEKFMKEGYTVAALSVDSDEQVKIATERLSKLGDFCYIRCNVANKDDCKNAVDEVVEKYKRIDVLANVAGVVGERKDLVDANLEDIENTIQINLMGSIYMAKFIAEQMKKQHSGTIINIGSICGIIANQESIGYHASKGAVKMFTQALARELTPYGIRVVSVAPGWVRTGMLLAEVEKIGASLHMRNKVTEPEEVANVIYLLTLKEACLINGSTVLAEDGYTSFKGVAPV